MKFIIVLLLALIATASCAGGRKKKIKHESSVLNKKLTGKSTKPAIIAIEIVDPHENKTSKTTKRTIDSNLGYGYQKYQAPKYQVYKYSQHDIPPYHGPPQHFSNGIKTHQYDIQKSISYQLPSIKSEEHNSGNLAQYYRPGTTFFSTVNNQGQVGGLSSHLPQQQYGNEPQVPVIILRVFPSQLAHPGALRAHLPQSHPLANTINQLDIQSLLTKYVQNSLVEPQNHYQAPPQQQYYQPEPQYEPPQPQYEPPQPQYKPPQQQYEPQQQEYEYQQEYPQTEQQQDEGLLTHENYPRETHTRVIFRTDKNKQGIAPADSKNLQSIATAPQSYTMVQVQLPDMQYVYGNEEGSNGQVYFYHGDQNQQQEYYQQQGEQNAEYPVEEEKVVYEQPPQTYTYHNPQKRSKKRVRNHRTTEDEITLEPIKA